MTATNHRTSRPHAPLGRSLILAICVALLGSCGESEPTADAAPAEPRHGGRLVVAVQDDAKSLDPHAVTDAASMRMIENLYATLLRYGDTFDRYVPDLATGVETSDDGRTVTIRLREDATFHSGRPVTAEDVVYSLRRIRDMGVRAGQLGPVESIEASGGATVVLRLSAPFAPLRSALAYPMNAVVDREVVEANGGRLDRVDAGAGPFKLVEWKRDQRLVMERHEGYHLPDRPYLDRLVYRPIPDDTSRSTALRTGEVDVVHDVAAKNAAILEQADGAFVESVPGTFWEYIGLNTRRPPLDDPRVRQAIAWAVDRDQLNTLVKFGRATPLRGGHIPPNHPAHADFVAYPQRDVEKAKALLRDAGAEDLAITLKVGSAFPYQVQAGEVVKQQLADAGIDVTLQALESNVLFAALGSGDFEATLVGWVGFVDADQWMYDIYHSEGAYNQQGYANSEVDRLLEEARTTLDPAARAALYAEAQRIVANDAPTVFLYLNDHTVARRGRVGGLGAHPTGSTIGLRDVWVAEAGR